MHTEAKLPRGLELLRRFDFPHKLGISERLFGNKLSQLGTCHVRCANGVLWKLDLTNPCHRWIVYGDYEGPAQMRWVRQWLNGGGHVVDSGANIGQTTLYFFMFGGVTVHAFEPTQVAADWLASCIQENAAANVRLVRAGLSSQRGRMTIQLDDARSTLRMDWYRNADLKTETVDLVRLDDYLAEAGIDKLRLWKLDVEGHELQALAGAAGALDRKGIDAILIEVSDSTFEDVKAFLDARCYEVFAISDTSALVPFAGTVTHNLNLVAMPRH